LEIKIRKKLKDKNKMTNMKLKNVRNAKVNSLKKEINLSTEWKEEKKKFISAVLVKRKWKKED